MFYNLMNGLFFGCSLFKEPPPIVSSIKQEGDHIVVNFAPESKGYYQACTDHDIALFLNESEERRKLMLDHESLGEWYVGYYLDEEFVYPTFDEGCDVLSCEQWGNQTSVSLESYTLDENRPPPPDYAKSFHNTSYTEADIPKSVKSVVSQPIRGSVDVEVYYFTHEECKGKQRVYRQQITVE